MNDSMAIAIELDQADELASYRNDFIFPKNQRGQDFLYFAGNSLGLQPKKTRQFINDELDDWAKLGVEGHLNARHPWLPYHELVCEKLARVVGAMPIEVVAMNSVTVNLHLMMTSFYRPNKTRHKIIIEGGAFPSDQYAVQSQIKLHGFKLEDSLVELKPRLGEDNLRSEDILATIEKSGSELALVLLGNVNYLTGQYYNISEITRAAHKVGARVGFDLAHGAGNLELKLHDDDVDFAVWCHYKYLNAGPGAIGGCFVHEKHGHDFSLPRLAGWWGHNKSSRFKMGPNFDPIPGAEGWQISNPPIFQLAALRASLEIFDAARMPRLAKKSRALTAFLEKQIKDLPALSVVTPSNPEERGTQISLRAKNLGQEFTHTLQQKGVICDFREPDIIRVAPAPLYTRYQDIIKLVEVLKDCLK